MKDFETKFAEYLREQGYGCAESIREVDDLTEFIQKQRNDLDAEQREEAMRIFEEFFENADELQISDALYPVLKVRSQFMVRHLATSKIGYVTSNAENMISQKFDEMRIGGEFNVNVEYMGTYDRGRLISLNSESETATDEILVTIELELF